MPDFAANLSTMFTDLPFLERFDAAARCGFDAVELAFPYAYPKEEVAKRLHEHRLTLVAFNLPAGRSEEGEHGIVCHPTERRSSALVSTRRLTTPPPSTVGFSTALPALGRTAPAVTRFARR
jgi:hydroxypyruvate isomerase